MKSADEIRAEYAAKAEKEIAEMNVKIAITESLPVEPRFIYVGKLYGRVASVRYDAKTKAEAFGFAKQFMEKLPSYYVKKGGTSCVRCTDDEKADSSVELLASVHVDQFHATLRFFVNTAAGIAEIDIEMPVHLFGHYYKSEDKAVKNFTMEWQPKNKTLEMYRLAQYARAYPFGEQSGKNFVYALYDEYEIENQFSGE